MLIGTVLLLSLLLVPLAGGSVGRLAALEPRARGSLVAGLGLQIVIISVVPEGGRGLHAAVHVGSYALLAAFLWVNRGVPFLWLIALGGALNLVAIAANGGVMPADAGALAAAGIIKDPGAFTNSVAVADPKLLFLGDVFWVPASWPVSNAFSIGDVVIAAGAFLALHTIAGSRLALPRFAVLGARRPAAPQPSA
jgi:hypothetical protein